MMNRIWLITGANSGFGRAITEAAVVAGDVAGAILGHLDSVRSDIATWEKLARDTQLPS
jgi:NAD(P)-dependent dehydrogenase (short-subunit alcohol dehydrogenase family)